LKPKILLFDIETAPIIVYNWQLFQETTHPKFIRRNWFILCWSAKWLNKDKRYHASLPMFRGYKELPSKTQNNIDKGVIKQLRELLDECDVAVAHNLKAFDRKKANTRFIINGMKPPSPYHMIDTLTVARSEFKFTSNRLEYLCKKLGVTEKMKLPEGFELWLGCEAGDKECWDKMIKYCDQDVLSLEAVYLKQRPYIRNHPNLNIITEDQSCPKCNSDERTKDGIRYTNSGIFQKWRCKGCGSSLKISTKQGKVTNA